MTRTGRACGGVIVAALCIAGLASHCQGQSEDQGGRLDRARKFLTPELVEIVGEHRAATFDHAVIVLGECHPSVKTQVEFASLFQTMLDANVLDAVLVEGSSGPILSRPFVGQAGRIFHRDILPRIWKDMLTWGQLAGYEYVLCSRPDTTVFGVEDMEAKARHTVRLAFDTEQLASAAECLSKGANTLRELAGLLAENGSKQDAENLTADLATLDSAIASYRAAVAEYLRAAGTTGAEDVLVDIALTEARASVIQAKPAFQEIMDTQAEALELVRQNGARTAVDPATVNTLRSLQAKLETYATGHASELKQMEGLRGHHKDLASRYEEVEAKLLIFA